MEDKVSKEKADTTEVCKVCGEPLSRYIEAFRLFVPHNCKCKRDKSEADKRREDEKKERERRDDARLSCFADKKRLLKFTFDSFDRENGNALEVKAACFRYAENFAEKKKEGIGLFIYGSTGTGKTHLAAAVCNYLIDNAPHSKPFFTDFREISNRMISGDAEYAEKLRKRALVVFDDFGTECRSKLTEDKIREAINIRVNSGLPMIVVSDYTRERMMKPACDFEKYVFSRIYEVCDSVHIDAGDFRKRKYTERKKEMS